MNGNSFYPYNIYNADKNIKATGTDLLKNNSSCSTSACLFTSESVNYADVFVKNYDSQDVYKTPNKGGNNYLSKLVTNSQFANTRLIANFSDMEKNVNYFALSTEGNGVITYNSADANTQPVTVVQSYPFLFSTLSSVMYLKSSDSSIESPFCCVTPAVPPDAPIGKEVSVLAFMRSTPNPSNPTGAYVWDELNNKLLYSTYNFETDEKIVGAPYIDYEEVFPDMSQYPIYVATHKDDRIKVMCCRLDESDDFFDVNKELVIYNKQFSAMTDFQLTSAMYLYNKKYYVVIFNAVIGGKLQWFKVIAKGDRYNSYTVNYNEPLEQIGDNSYVCYMSNQGLYVPKNIPVLAEYTNDSMPEDLYSLLTHGLLNISCINKDVPYQYPTGQTTLMYLLYNHLVVNENMVWTPVKTADIIRVVPNTELYLILSFKTSFNNFSIKYDLYSDMIFIDTKIVKSKINFITTVAPYIDYFFPTAESGLPFHCILCCDKRNIYSIEEGEDW